MDEPLSNLDAKLRLEMRAEIRRIHDAIGSTTIYVTHDQDEALSLADRIVVMREGLIRQIGTPEELYERPLHPDVAEFMGFRTRLPGRVVSVAGDRAVVEASGARLEGIVREAVSPGDAAIAMIRPEDFVVTEDAAGVGATVVAIEYRGRAFFGLATADDGTEIFFRSETRRARGDRIRLKAGPERVIVFSGAER